MIPRCRLCPRNCGVPRGDTGEGVCKSGEKARVARAALHFWEEPPISGKAGSGAVFFTGCSLGCVYCQNYEISAGENRGREVTPEELSALFQNLVDQGAQNINLVTAGHFLPQVRQALLLRKPPVPVVYNSSGYEKREAVKSLQGLVDIYLPDLKYGEEALARDLSRAPDYVDTALAAIGEMVEQAGPPQYDGEGRMVKGVLIRHLVLPGHTRNSMAVLRLIRQRFPGIPVSLMAQYTPWGLAAQPGGVPGYPELSRSLTRREWDKVQEELFSLGLEGFVQSRRAKGSQYIPDFHQFDGPR